MSRKDDTKTEELVCAQLGTFIASYVILVLFFNLMLCGRVLGEWFQAPPTFSLTGLACLCERFYGPSVSKIVWIPVGGVSLYVILNVLCCDWSDLLHLRDRNVEDLSGGELQRFACAVVCIQKADMFVSLVCSFFCLFVFFASLLVCSGV